MAAANIASTGIVLEVLTRDNYLDWSVLVMNYLKGKKLWKDVVEGTPDLDNEDGQSKNAQALHAIQLSCGHYALRQIRNYTKAQDAWNHLKTDFSEDLRADNGEHIRADNDTEKGDFQTDNFYKFHLAVKKGIWKDAILFIKNNEGIISQKLPSNGWTALHVAVDAGQVAIMKELVEKGALLTESDWQGYTPFALAAKSTDDTEMVKWMLDKEGNDDKGENNLLTMKINAGYDDNDKGDIPVLLAAAKGHKNMTRFLFSKTPWLILTENNCYYGAKLLSHCIHAEIFGKC